MLAGKPEPFLAPYRIGVNHAALDVDRPRCPVHHDHRDGQPVLMAISGVCRTMNPTVFASRWMIRR
jgi:catalase